jgi:serine O-acetyltransferase
MPIQSKKDYLFYLEADRIALGKKGSRPHLIGDDVWKFQRILRKSEYINNCKKGLLSRIYFKYLYFRWYKMCLKFGFFIPPNVFGPGLSIAFYSGPIIVNSRVRAGADIRISPGVTIGHAARGEGVPKLGNHIFIGPSAVLVGPIEIADGIAIGANSYVNKSFKEPNITIAGSPAKKVANVGSAVQQATKLVGAGFTRPESNS